MISRIATYYNSIQFSKKVNTVTNVIVTDQLKNQLSTSLTSYNNASVNDWVKITSTEYSSIFSNITGAAKFQMIVTTTKSW